MFQVVIQWSGELNPCPHFNFLGSPDKNLYDRKLLPRQKIRLMESTLIYPHQLYENHPAASPERIPFLIEEPLFFRQYPFHKKKIILHRASMQSYADQLREQGHTVQYLESSKLDSSSTVFSILHSQGIGCAHICEVTDDWLTQRITKAAQTFDIQLVWHPTPNFLTQTSELESLLPANKSLRMNSFYIKQRQRLGILLDGEGPVGGKWSFDADNRKRLPKKIELPSIQWPAANTYVKEAVAYTQQHFAQNPGSSHGFAYPIDHESARKFLNQFLEARIDQYGAYQDAIDADQSYLFHSVLTPALNIGLLHPQEIVQATLDRHADRPMPLNSLEGFIRQVIGWREYVRGVYLLKGRIQRTTNFFQHHRPIPKLFWDANTGILPFDTAMQRVLDSSYANHIERLMVFSNLFLLCEFAPDQVYRWFSSLFIDAFDWVMVPNVYGMGQYADGGLMITKPYVSSSNYLRKMSYFKQGDWSVLWDGLYWRFMNQHRSLFERNPRTRMTVSHLDRMGDKLDQHLQVSAAFLDSF